MNNQFEETKMNEFAQLFIEAVKQGLTFVTSRGSRTISELWTLPLTGNNGYNLDSISRELLAEKRKSEEVSLVTDTSAGNKELNVRIEILRYIIEDKKRESSRKRQAMELAEKRRELQEAIAKKQKLAVEEKSIEELQAELLRVEQSL